MITRDTSNGDLVTVVMPAFNAEVTISRAIDSVITQTHQAFELIIVDDCSSDTTALKIASIRDPRLIYLRNQVNLGAPASRNRGIKIAKGRYLAFLDADDAWATTKLALQISHMRSTGSVLSAHSYRVWNRHGKSLTFCPPAKVSYQRLLAFNVISNCATMIDREKLREDVYFKPLRSRQDHAMSLQITREYGPATTFADVLLDVYLQSGSVSSNKSRAIIDQWVLYRDAECLGILESLLLMARWSLSGLRKYIQFWNTNGKML